jgi:hypothetical protein
VVENGIQWVQMHGGYLSLHEHQNLAQDCIENTFNWKSLSKNLPLHWQYMSSKVPTR